MVDNLREDPSYIVCTLCEREAYFRGALVLLNSLLQRGFDGLFCVGYRNVPERLRATFRKEFDALRSTGSTSAELEYVEVEHSRHFTNHKPFFLHRIRNRCAEPPSGLWYIDPDVVVKAQWENLVSWTRLGIAVCEDINSPVYRRHPRRLQWREIAEDHGIDTWDPLDIYVNGGFLGLNDQNLDFIDRWIAFIEIMERRSEVPEARDQGFVELRDQFREQGATSNDPFIHMDQDCLNAALSCSSWPVSPVGKEGMDFEFGGRWMSHAIGPRKPWNKSFVRLAFQGFSPRQVDHNYWNAATSPLPVHSQSEVRQKQFQMKAAAFIQRFIT